MLALVVASHLFYLAVALAAAALVPAFDSSASDTQTITIRWDVLHFKDISDHGYRWEHQYAFFPAMPFLLRYLSPLALFLLKTILAWRSAVTLYDLSLHHFRRHDISRLTVLLSLIPFSPPALYLAPYTEPFFTYLSYSGMLCCVRGQWYPAAIFFSLASTFRSNGFFLAGFIIWGIFFPHLRQKRFPPISDAFTAIATTTLILLPFIGHSFGAYLAFCMPSDPPQWCLVPFPSIYTYVQSAYWNVGLLKYWEWNQLPNFFIALAPFFVSSSYILQYLWYFLSSLSSSDPFICSSIVPHAIYTLLLMSILLFVSHIQIALRLAASMPLTYWGAAYLLTHPDKYPTASRIWIPWVLVWSVVSVILWVAFLPPA